MADATPGAAPSSNRNVMILLSYLWLLALVPLLTTFLTKPSETMSFCRSGSVTAFNAARTISGVIRNSAYHAGESR